MLVRGRLVSPILPSLVAGAGLCVGCHTVDFSSPAPSGGDASVRSVGPLATDFGRSWYVESGSIPGPFLGPSEPIAVGEALVLSSDPAARSNEVSGLLVGARAGRAGRLVIRVRR